MKLLKYTRLNCYIVIGVFFIINLIIYLKKHEKIKIDKNKISKILIMEIIFFVTFLFWAYVRSYTPELNYTTEKFMNFGFMNALYKAEYMPVEDIWLSGYKINYYYFGQYMASFLTKISCSNVYEGFNLSVAMINSFTFILPLIIAYNLGKTLIKDSTKKIANIVPVSTAILAGIAVSLGGTLYFPIYNFIVDRNGETYYYWEDTRYIGYRPDTNDKTINEIVPYSNMVGDLHAHHIDTMFVFLTLALLLQLLLDDDLEEKYDFKFPIIILLGIVLGIQKMTNYWDFPIYLVVMFITIIFNNFMRYKFCKKFFLTTLVQILQIVIFEELISLPFTLDLYISATKVFLTHITSPFYKMLVLWGLPVFCVLLHILDLFIKFIKTKEKGKFWSRLADYISNISKADMFVFIVGCCAIGLVIIPEIVYVKDIYGDEFKRANTVYKLCYQADIMLDIIVGYILVKFLYEKNFVLKKIIASLLLVAFVSTFGYGMNAINYVTNGFNQEKILSLADTENYIKVWYPHEYDAIRWIKENIPDDKIILEKASGSYTINGHVSAFTGNPTVLGWQGHEWIWRANRDYTPSEAVSERWGDVYTMYTTLNVAKLEEIIDKYNISYIYISDVDTNQYITQNKATLKLLGEVVYEYEDLANDRNSICIVKVGE